MIFISPPEIPVNQTDPAGNTALHWASRYVLFLLQIWPIRGFRAGELDCVLLLLSVGQISINKTNKLGDTPAILAAHHGRSQCLDALLQVGIFIASLVWIIFEGGSWPGQEKQRGQETF